MRNVLHIKNKDAKMVRFYPNSTQKRFLEQIENMKSEGKPVRIIILKARQMGFSTVTEALIYHKSVTTKFMNSTIIAHEEKASTNLFNMSKLFYDYSEREFRPMLKASNAKELVFENPSSNQEERKDNPGLKSKIQILTAKGKGVGRSDTIHNLHISELAFWDNAEEVATGLMQCVPDTSSSMVVIESTAKGLGGYYHSLWKNAVLGENDYIPLFYAWFECKEYKREIRKKKGEDKFSLEERTLQTIYKLTDEQLNWRRYTIRNKLNGDSERFKQEYPSNPTEAFLSSGRPRFNIKMLKEHYDKCVMKELVRGYIEVGDKVVTNSKGYIRFFAPLKKHGQYLIAADVAEGLAHGDYSVAKVVDIKTWEQVAAWHGHTEPNEFGSELAKLGRHYNNAIIAPEANNHGVATLTRLSDTEEYPDNLIFHSNYTKARGDDDFKNPEKRKGWYTTSKTKKLIIDNLAQLINERGIPEFSRNDIDELYTYVLDDKGSTNADDGCFDDRCFVAGTKILTSNGQVPIEKVSIGDLVLTRNGYRPVIHTNSSIQSVISKIGLTGTGDHPILTTDGWKELALISEVDILYVWNALKQKIDVLSYTEARDTVGIHKTSKRQSGCTIGGQLLIRRLFHYIGKNGWIIMEKYRRGMSFIIKMETLSIMKLRILNVWKDPNIQENTPKTPVLRKHIKKTEKSLQLLGLLLLRNGAKIIQKRIALIVPRMARKTLAPFAKDTGGGTLKTRSELKEYSETPQSKVGTLRAKGSLLQGSVLFVSLSIMLRKAMLNIVLKIARLFHGETKRRVYNLQVLDTPEYFANNILVHNCITLAIGYYLINHVEIKNYRDDDGCGNCRKYNRTKRMCNVTGREINDVTKTWCNQYAEDTRWLAPIKPKKQTGYMRARVNK